MKHLDLFSGIGGFALAARNVGWETVGFCEIEPYAQKILAKHWPGVPIYEDVRTLNGYELEPVDIITGGFPCQDISTAGKQAGIDGERSGLWSDLARIIGEVRPRYAVLENVAALLSGDRGRWFQRVLGDLAEIGYDCEWHCIPASAVGAPHRRDRVWIIAHAHSVGCDGFEKQDIRPEAGIEASRRRDAERLHTHVADTEHQRPQGQGQYEQPIYPEAATIGQAIKFVDGGFRDFWAVEPRLGFCPDGFPGWLVRHCGRGLSYAESQGAVETLQTVWSDDAAKAVWSEIGGLDRMEATAVLFAFLREYPQASDLRRLLKEGQKAFAERVRSVRERLLPGSTPYRPRPDEQYEVEHPDFVCAMSWQASSWNTFEGGIPRVANSVPNRVNRLKGLGNAIVPQVAEVIFRAIIDSNPRQ